MKQFARRLRQLRQERGFSQADLGRLAKMHTMQVGKYERGEAFPAAESLVALSRALEVTIDFLVTGDNEPPHDEARYRFPLLFEKLRELDEEIERRDVPSVLDFLDAYIAKKRIKKIAG